MVLEVCKTNRKFSKVLKRYLCSIRELKRTMMAMATKISPNKRFDEQNNGYAPAFLNLLTFHSCPLQSNNLK